MKKILLCFLLLAGTALSCKNLPVIKPVNKTNYQNNSPFLKSKYRLTHSIKAVLPNNERLAAIGITVADPGTGSIDAVLVTVEGFVLLDVSYKKKSFIIKRSVPPFDSNDFARALIDDIKIIYFIPDFIKQESGKLNNSYVTRYYCEDNNVTDIFTIKNGKTDIIKYDSSNAAVRTVNISSVNQENIPEKIKLIAHGFFGYSLTLKLINYEKI